MEEQPQPSYTYSETRPLASGSAIEWGPPSGERTSRRGDLAEEGTCVEVIRPVTTLEG